MRNFSPERAVFWAIAATVLSSFIMCLMRREWIKDFWLSIVTGLKEGAMMSTAEVAAACAAAGIIIGSITMSGLGIRFSSLVVDASMGSLAQMGVVPLAAHLFVLYFGTRADITPPVALAAYAGSGVAGSDPMKTGVRAFQLGIAGFIIPFMCVYAPELLLIGHPVTIGITCMTAFLGIYCLAAGVQACMLVPSKWYETLIDKTYCGYAGIPKRATASRPSCSTTPMSQSTPCWREVCRGDPAVALLRSQGPPWGRLLLMAPAIFLLFRHDTRKSKNQLTSCFIRGVGFRMS